MFEAQELAGPQRRDVAEVEQECAPLEHRLDVECRITVASINQGRPQNRSHAGPLVSGRQPDIKLNHSHEAG